MEPGLLWAIRITSFRSLSTSSRGPDVVSRDAAVPARLLLAVAFSLGVAAQPLGDGVARHPALGHAEDELNGLRWRRQRQPIAGAFEKQPRGLERRALVAVVEHLVANQAIKIERGQIP